MRARPFLRAALGAWLVVTAWLGWTGLVDTDGGGFRDAFYGWPFIAGVTLSAGLVLGGLRTGSARRRLLVAVLLLAAAGGLAVGRLAGFSGDLVLTEGQIVRGRPGDYQPGSLSRGPYAEEPGLEIRLDRVLPGPPLRAELSLHLRGEGRVREGLELGTGPRLLPGGTLVRIRQWGYAPAVRLRDSDGKVLDEAYVALLLRPAGREDSFRFLTPHTFALRYTPGTGGAAGRYRVRIARNKDLVVDEIVEEGGSVAFDDAVLELGEPRRWIRLAVLRDPGAPVAVLAALLALLFSVMDRKGRKAAGTGSSPRE